MLTDTKNKIPFIYILTFFIYFISCQSPSPDLKKIFANPPESAKPWIYWYWRKAAISKEGIKRELIAMKKQGLGGAYLFTVQGAENPPLFDPSAEVLTPYWWKLLDYAFRIADSLHFKLGMHVCDGFSIAGGPWITPELSMQKIVWKDTIVTGGKIIHLSLPQPENYQGFYKDIGLFAFPALEGSDNSTRNIEPKVTSNIKGVELQFLPNPDGKTRFRSEDSCWIQYEFKKPFTCRTIEIFTVGNNLQSHRLIIEASNDGTNFRQVTRLKPPRHGWQDDKVPITHCIIPTTARFFRFVYSLKGTLPAAEDYDAAKWKQSLKIAGIVLSEKPTIHQFEGKTGIIWRISDPTTTNMLPDSLCIPLSKIKDISNLMDNTGMLCWDAPPGKWTILRIGHTSTGFTNYIGGAAIGLECDKLNPETVKYQFENWFGKVFEELDYNMASRVLKMFHTDSWEAASQNWSPVFRNEFIKRRGYDLFPYLPVMTGLPVENTEVSECFLHDIRLTISELLSDNFFGTLADLARKKRCVFSAESVAPTFTSDGIQHFKMVDIPMGEFWYNSPTHDKPNDILDAISGAHLYGKKIIQSESFTTLRMQWDEFPGMLKSLQDRNYALGINRMVYHVMTHNPWTERKPGMTLDRVGLYFQPDQTWWEPAKAWIEYARRCQSLLQQGVPVVDLAVFTGEEIPSRALTPDRLIPYLPGLFDQEIIEREKKRNENLEIPYQDIPPGVLNTANTFNPANWIDPLNGYLYDSFNKDALLQANVKNGKIILPGGASYSMLIIPGNKTMSHQVANKLAELIKLGGTVLLCERPAIAYNIHYQNKNDNKSGLSLYDLLNMPVTDSLLSCSVRKPDKGILLEGTISSISLHKLGIEQDFIAMDTLGDMTNNIAWCHRSDKNFDIYFISNQENSKRKISISLRTVGRIPEIYNPVDGTIREANNWNIINYRTILPLQLEKNGSLFVVLQKKTKMTERPENKKQINCLSVLQLQNEWSVMFDTEYGGPEKTVFFDSLVSWSDHPNEKIKYYSGTATYTKSFQYDNKNQNIYLDLQEVYNIAHIYVNNQDCGICWTPPYRVDISQAIRTGENNIKIEVTNTWRNRLIGDHQLNNANPVTWTTAPYNVNNLPLLKGGLLGNIELITFE